MLELVQQEGEGASPFRDLYAETEQGLHHVAIMVPDFEAALAHFAQLGIPRVTEAVTLTGVEFAFLDARETLGHYLEIYEASAALRGFYRFVADAAQAPWNPDEPFITRT
jgi:catechol 2,3-dioxygenase-like lactoylglutathione lyase family enzyme